MEPLQPSDQWRCHRCGHLEEQSSVRCTSCSCLRLPTTLLPSLETASLRSPSQDDSAEKMSRDEALEVAIERLQKLFTRAQREGTSLSDADRAQLYEALLSSLLKAERTTVRRATFKEFFAREREAQRRAHMIHLSVIWFLGICTGLALYFGLEAVAKL